MKSWQRRQIDIHTDQLKFQEKRIEALEKDSHPPCPLECFDGYDELVKKIQKLEKEVESLTKLSTLRNGK
ncbi:MAG: hypothetical protein CMA64_04210 [Euryarchaeota archaeon]|jgi:hypothetical protein|nr:hypothetical protein [Euryarchaeota archaeon]